MKTRSFKKKEGPTEIDVHVETRLRGLRAENLMTQAELADACGITFQQIQKYESGQNRISASRMWQMCQVLGAAPDDFFKGL